MAASPGHISVSVHGSVPIFIMECHLFHSGLRWVHRFIAHNVFPIPISNTTLFIPVWLLALLFVIPSLPFRVEDGCGPGWGKVDSVQCSHRAGFRLEQVFSATQESLLERSPQENVCSSLKWVKAMAENTKLKRGECGVAGGSKRYIL